MVIIICISKKIEIGKAALAKTIVILKITHTLMPIIKSYLIMTKPPYFFQQIQFTYRIHYSFTCFVLLSNPQLFLDFPTCIVTRACVVSMAHSAAKHTIVRYTRHINFRDRISSEFHKLWDKTKSDWVFKYMKQLP